MGDDNLGNSSRPTFSLLFLTWNSEGDIERTLDSVLDQTYSDFEIVVVDNNSVDQTVPLIKDKYVLNEKVRLIENESNLGFTRGINRGIGEARGEYICCYNDDTYFSNEYLETLSEYVTPDTVWTTARINHRVSSNYRTVRLLTRHRFPIPYVVDPHDGTADVNYVPGDGLLVPRRVYEEELEGLIFDWNMPEKGEDIDLSLRLQKQGVPMKAILDTYSIHPDEGFYSPTIENGLNHLTNVFARFRAYRKNDFGPVALLSVIASVFTVPVEIHLRSFPRDAEAFRRRTTD